MSHKMVIFKAGIDFVLGPPKNQFNDGIDSHKESILRFCGIDACWGPSKFSFKIRALSNDESALTGHPTMATYSYMYLSSFISGTEK